MHVLCVCVAYTFQAKESCNRNTWSMYMAQALSAWSISLATADVMIILARLLLGLK